jgi:hypothetical protein
LRTFWGTHWELEKHVENSFENLMGTHKRKEIQHLDPLPKEKKRTIP